MTNIIYDTKCNELKYLTFVIVHLYCTESGILKIYHQIFDNEDTFIIDDTFIKQRSCLN